MTTKLTPGDNNDNNGDNNENKYDDDTNNDPDDNDDDPVASDADLLLGGMISPLPSHSPHTAWLCCTIPGPIWKRQNHNFFSSCFLSRPNLDCLYLDPPPLAAGAALDVGSSLSPAVVANSVPRRRKLPRL